MGHLEGQAIGAGLASFGQGIGRGVQQRGLNIQKEQERINKAKATSQFLKAFGGSLGLEPEQLEGASVDELNSFGEFIPQLIQLQGVKGKQAKATREQETATGVNTFLSTLAQGASALSEGQPVDETTSELLQNPQLVELANASSLGLPVTQDAIENALKGGTARSLQLKAINLPDGKQQQQLFNPRTGQFTDLEFPITRKTVQGIKTPEQVIFEKRALGSVAANEKILDASRGAGANIQKLKVLDRLLDEGIETGFAQNLLVNAGKALKRFGVEDATVDKIVGGVDEAALFASIGLDLAQGIFFERTSGSISDKETELFLSAVPSLSNTAEGNKKIIKFMVAAEEKGQQLSKQIREWRRAGVSPDDIEDRIIDFNNDPKNDISNILFEGGLPQEPAAAGEQITLDQSVQPTTVSPTITTQKEFDALPQGSSFIFNGRAGTKK